MRCLRAPCLITYARTVLSNSALSSTTCFWAYYFMVEWRFCARVDDFPSACAGDDPVRADASVPRRHFALSEILRALLSASVTTHALLAADRRLPADSSTSAARTAATSAVRPWSGGRSRLPPPPDRLTCCDLLGNRWNRLSWVRPDRRAPEIVAWRAQCGEHLSLRVWKHLLAYPSRQTPAYCM